MIKDAIPQLQKLSVLFQQIAAENYELDDLGRWRLRAKEEDAAFDIPPTEVVARIRDNISESFMHAVSTSYAFTPNAQELEILGDLIAQACARNCYQNFRLLGCGQSGLVIEGITDDGQHDALRFGLRTCPDWRLDVPLMIQSSYGTFTDARGLFLLEAMPPVLMLGQQNDVIRILVENAFETPGYARHVTEELLLGTPYVLTLFHDLALFPDGTIVNVDPENISLNPLERLAPQQLRCKLLMNASRMDYCPSFLELYTPDGQTKQELFFPTKNRQPQKP